MAEVLAEILSPAQKDYSIKINGKEYKLRKINMRKLLVFHHLCQEMTSLETLSIEKLDRAVTFLCDEILIGAKTKDFEDIDGKWFIEISNAIGKVLMGDKAKQEKSEVKPDPKEVTTPKP